MRAAERFGNRVRELRQRRRLSQEALGERIGSDGARISKLERGIENPTLETLDSIATALGADVSELLTRPEEEGTGHVGEVGGASDPVLNRWHAEQLAKADALYPSEDSWRGDVLQAQAALAQAQSTLTRALRRREADDDPVAGPADKVG